MIHATTISGTVRLDRAINYGMALQKDVRDPSILSYVKRLMETEEVTTRDRNFYAMFHELGQKIPETMVSDPDLETPAAIEFLQEIPSYGACYEIAWVCAQAFKEKGKETILWLGFIDFSDNGVYSGSYLHAFLTRKKDDTVYLFDPINVRRRLEGQGSPSHYCGFPIPYEVLANWYDANGGEQGPWMWFLHFFNKILASDGKTRELIEEIKSKYGEVVFS